MQHAFARSLRHSAQQRSAATIARRAADNATTTSALRNFSSVRAASSSSSPSAPVTPSPLAAALALGARWKPTGSIGSVRFASSSSAAVAAAAAPAAQAAATAADPSAAAATVLNSSSSPAVDAASAVSQVVSEWPALDPTSALHFLPRMAQGLLDQVHLLTGLPWWASIVVTVVGLRLCLFPFAVSGAKNLVKMSAMKPEIRVLQREHRELAAAYHKLGQPLPMEAQMDLRRNTVKIQEAHGFSPFSMIKGALFSTPIFLSFFVGLKSMAYVDPSFCSGGALWFPNLAALDPTGGLAFINAGLLVATIYLNAEQVPSAGIVARTMRRVMYATIIAFAPFAMYAFPSGVFVYWITNSAVLAIQGIALQQPFVRKMCGVPPVPPHSADDMDAELREMQAQWALAKESGKLTAERKFAETEAKYKAEQEAAKRAHTAHINPFTAEAAAAEKQQQEQQILDGQVVADAEIAAPPQDLEAQANAATAAAAGTAASPAEPTMSKAAAFYARKTREQK